MYFLDTSAILEVVYGSEKGKRIKEFIGDKPIFISALSVHEMLAGLKKSEVEKLKQFFKDATVLDFDQQAAFFSSAIERELRAKGQLINIMDLLLAGTCFLRKFTMITCDNDYLKINGLDTKIF